MAEPETPASTHPPGMGARRLRNYLINPLQVKYTLALIGISLILTGGLGYLVMYKAREASRIVEVRALDPTDELAMQLKAQFANHDLHLLIGLVIFAALLSLLLASYGIVMSHKVAGPLFRIEQYVEKLAQGKLVPLRDVRRGDELIDFVSHFRQAVDRLRSQAEAELDLLDRAAAAVADASLASELKTQAERIRAALSE